MYDCRSGALTPLIMYMSTQNQVMTTIPKMRHIFRFFWALTGVVAASTSRIRSPAGGHARAAEVLGVR